MAEPWPDFWPVIEEAERAQWAHVPFERVGPLRFGSGLREAAAVMKAAGYTSAVGSVQDGVAVRFRKAAGAGDGPDVTALFVPDPGLSVGEQQALKEPGLPVLTFVAVDARHGPQVVWDGLRLIGRAPSELMGELAVSCERYGMGLSFAVTGSELDMPEAGFVPRVQRAGDRLLTRVVFTGLEGWDPSLGIDPELLRDY